MSCPYWVVNKTNLTMKVKDTTLNASQPVAAPPGLGGQAEPVMFRCLLISGSLAAFSYDSIFFLDPSQLSSIMNLHTQQPIQVFLMCHCHCLMDSNCVCLLHDLQTLMSWHEHGHKMKMVNCKTVKEAQSNKPVIYSTARGGMRVSVHQGAWSKAINLENLGLHYNFHVLGPPQAVGRAEQMTGDVNESIMHFDCERTIAPRGFSPRKSTCVPLSAIGLLAC